MGRRNSAFKLIILVGVVPTLLFIIPLFFVTLNSLFVNGVLSIENYVRFFSSRTYLKSLQNSLFIAGMSTICIAPLGLLIVSTTRRHKKATRAAKLLTSLPLVFSSYVFCIALIYLYGRTGIVTSIFLMVGLTQPISNYLYSITGIIFANILFFLPFFILPLFSSFEDLNPRLEEVAESLGSYGFHKFRRVIAPQILYSFITGCLLTFLLVFNQISVILALGAGKTYTLTYQLFAQYEGFQYNMANTIAVVSIIVTFLVTMMFQLVLRRVWKK